MNNGPDDNIAKMEFLLESIRKKIHAIPTQKLACKDVTFAQIKVIRFLEQIRQASMKDVAHSLGVTLPTATGLVENLVNNGYLKRHQDTKDRRIVYVSLSAKGYRLLVTFAKMRRAWITEIRDSMSMINWFKFIGAMEIIDNLLNDAKQL